MQEPEGMTTCAQLGKGIVGAFEGFLRQSTKTD